MEVCFADVAQGSASAILLGEGQAIVIDCGARQSRTLIALLERFRVSTIARLVVTHNHADHSAGAAALLTHFRGRIEQIWMVYDTVLTDSLFWNRVNEELSAGRLQRRQLRRLEYRGEPTEVYRERGVLLSVIAPDLAGSVAAVEAANPNATSGVLVLRHATRQVVFAGDSTIPEWRVIAASRGDRPIRCMILTVPHHGGGVWEPRRPEEGEAAYATRVRTDLDWLYTQAVTAELNVVSVGTSNSYRHPRAEVIEAARRAGGVVVCTQMTARCDPDLEGQRRRALPIIHPSRSSSDTQRTGNGASSNVACGGTLIAEITAAGANLQRLAEHQATVARVPHVAGTRPLCRR